MAVRILALFTLVLMVNSCGKKDVRGCTDVKSTNYSADATTDDGSCKYLADDYVGNYLVTDASSYISPNNGQLIKSSNEYAFSISKKDATTIEMVGFNSTACTKTLTANVSLTSIVITNQDVCSLGSFVGFKSGKTITFSYVFNAGVTYSYRGKALKLN
jgi:hypothetical protein